MVACTREAAVKPSLSWLEVIGRNGNVDGKRSRFEVGRTITITIISITRLCGKGKGPGRGRLESEGAREGGLVGPEPCLGGGGGEALRGALLHKIVKPGPTVAAPSRDSCKQRRVNLKMQIPPQGFLAWPLSGDRGDGGGKTASKGNEKKRVRGAGVCSRSTRENREKTARPRLETRGRRPYLPWCIYKSSCRGFLYDSRHRSSLVTRR